ncbi:MAG: 3-deoxy-D-manno-octulosonic acid transferase [Bacillota bacterium]
MILIIYNFLIIIFSVFLLPIYIFKVIINKKYRDTFKQRMGFIEKNKLVNKTNNKKIIWFHAASVGEIMIAEKLINTINEKHKKYDIILSTSTHSGKLLAEKKFKNNIYITMLPFDLPWIIKRFLKKISPNLVIIIEPDLWPNFIHYANKYSESIMMINAWFGKKSIGEYLFIPGLLPNMLNKLDFISVKSEKEYENIKKYINNLNKVVQINDLKFDIGQKEKNKRKKTIHYEIINKLKENSFLYLVAGSTHEGEEKILINIYKKLKNNYPDLRLILAPRNLNRVEEIIKLAKKNNFSYFKRSDYSKNKNLNKDLFILDTMGELKDFYSVSFISFIGGTLIKKGGHNPLEAVLQKNVILFGPNYFNIKDSANFLIDNEVAFVVNSEKKLLKKIKFLIDNLDMTKDNAKKAAELIKQQKGSIKKTKKIILNFID